MRHTKFFLIPAATLGTALALPEGFVMREFAGPPDADYPAAITAAGLIMFAAFTLPISRARRVVSELFGGLRRSAGSRPSASRNILTPS